MKDFFPVLGEWLVLLMLFFLSPTDNPAIFDHEDKISDTKHEQFESHVQEDNETDALVDDWEKGGPYEHRYPAHNVHDWEDKFKLVNILEILYIHRLLFNLGVLFNLLFINFLFPP